MATVVIPYTIFRVLPADVTAPAEARRVIIDVCELADCPRALCEDALLLVSELVTNVVVHGGPSAGLTVTTQTWGIHVDVSDEGVLLPEARLIDLQAESGRGLRLLEACSTDWGVRVDDAHCKTVWFELRTPPVDLAYAAR